MSFSSCHTHARAPRADRGVGLQRESALGRHVRVGVQGDVGVDGPLGGTPRSGRQHDEVAASRILGTLLSHLNWPKSENLEAVQTRARHELARMEKGLMILEMTAGAGPLIGLLGTLSGLVGIFAALGGAGDPVVVARGISEALNTTIAGLAVAVPSLIAHSYFLRRIEMQAVTMESVAAELLAKLYQPASHR